MAASKKQPNSSVTSHVAAAVWASAVAASTRSAIIQAGLPRLRVYKHQMCSRALESPGSQRP